MLNILNKKNIFAVTFLAILVELFLFTMPVNAETEILDGGDEQGYVVEYDTDTKECVVTFSNNNGMRTWKKTELNPETNQYESIADKYADKITKMVIGKDVTTAYLDGAVIPGFSKLNTIVIDVENTKLVVEDNIVYNKKNGSRGNKILLLPMSKCTEEYTLPDGVAFIGDHLFEKNNVVKKVIAKDIDTIGSWAFNKSSIQEFECDTLKNISDSGFQYAYNLEKVTINNVGITPIGIADSAFEGCVNLKEFPYLTSLEGGGAGGYFSGCRSLKGFELADNEDNIFVYSFRACTSMTNMVIPATVTAIGAGAFEGCISLGNLEFKSATPPSFQIDSLRGCPENMRIIVPTGSEEDYIAALKDATGCDYTDNIKDTGIIKYNLFVNGEQFTSEKLTIKCGSGTAIYDPATEKLTLNNATINEGINKYAYGGCINSGLKNLVIELNGSNVIDARGSYNDGISNETGCDVTLTGKGSLDISVENSCYAAYIGLGNDPTGVDGGDFIIDGATFNAKNVCVNRNFIVKNSGEADISTSVRSNQGGSIIVKDDASLKAASLDLGSPSANGEPVYEKDMKVVIDGGTLELTSGGIHFNEGTKDKDDVRGYVEILDGSIVIDKTVSDGDRIADCPASHITIDESFGITVEEFLKGGVDASSSNQRKVIIDMGGHGNDIIFEVDKGTEINEKLLYMREDVINEVGDDKTFAGFRLKPLSEFKDYDDFYADRENYGYIDGKNFGWMGWKTVVNKTVHVYACWFKTIDKAEVSMKAPICGRETKYVNESENDELSYKPEVVIPSGVNYGIGKNGDEGKKYDALYWITEPKYDADDFYKGSFTAEKKYAALIYLEAKFGYVFAEKTETTVNGAELKECVTDVKHGEFPLIGYRLAVVTEIKAVHSYGKWTELDADYHQRVCSGDSSHVEKAAHKWNKGKITKAATKESAGEKTFTCEICGATKKESIAKLPDDSKSDDNKSEDNDNKKGEDGTAFGKGASVKVAEKTITAFKGEADPKGSVFNVLQLKVKKVSKTNITLGWTKAKGATSYTIYGNKCGKKNKYEKIATVKKNSYKVTKINKKTKIKKGTYYKFIVIASDKNNQVVSTSKTVHVATSGGKVGNYKKVTTAAKKNKANVKVKKKFKLKAKAVAASKKLKVKKHRAIQYESANPKVATVNKKGVITGKKKGTCYVYAYSQSGVAAKIKVTVK